MGIPVENVGASEEPKRWETMGVKTFFRRFPQATYKQFYQVLFQGSGKLDDAMELLMWGRMASCRGLTIRLVFNPELLMGRLPIGRQVTNLPHNY